MLLEFFL